MIIRKIKPEELKRTMELFAIAFEMPLDVKEDSLELYANKSTHPASREDVCLLDKYGAFEDDNRSMFSCISVTTFDMSFDGNKVKMAGIGGVSSLPSHRNRGGIRGCFEQMLEDIYNQGYVFSILYPFSTAYYNKFGYGMSGGRKCYKLDLSFLKTFSKNITSCTLVEPSNRKELLPDVKYIYEKWQNYYNGMVMREDYEYAFILKADPVSTQEFTYVCYDTNNCPISYMTFTKNREAGEQIISCKEFVYVNASGLKALLGLAATFRADHKWITFYTSDFSTSVESVLPELSLGAAQINYSNSGMVRVVNVKKTLEMANYMGSDIFTIRIIDEKIAANNGVYEIAVENGKAKSVIMADCEDDKCDAIINIDDFSSLILGSREFGDLYAAGKIKCSEGFLHRYGRIFYRKPVLTIDYF